ncbi:sulfatase-like hydrolase/transferase [Rubrobacter tropicus]|uniref:Sulfatase-like hydrolase/transferase n=1 Tax=Rubrobacter tropicus TaxID=2653851 RepID=A0A6G8QDI3_9ACTN|nr:alkaline phosphatase family protein [Rubrobacter tropicus]QIN84539.1 sulfatase-like hydrolase/transferase [Rubrobacter tropicus]
MRRDDDIHAAVGPRHSPEPPRFLLGRADWARVLALLVPLIAYVLTLKSVRVARLPDEHGFFAALELMRSDLLFNAGYALLWVGLFSVARRGPGRAVVAFLFHSTAIIVALVATGAHQFYEVTGSTLGFDAVLYFVLAPREVGAVAASEASPALLAVVSAALLYAVFGPALLTRTLGRLRGWDAAPAGAGGAPWLGFTGAVLVSFGLVALSVLPAGGPAGASESFAKDPVVNAAMTGLEEIEGDGPTVDGEAVRERLPLETSLSQTARTEKRNVVIVHLESTRAGSVTPYGGDEGLTPYLNELAGKSLLAERAYASVPHTTNALVATMCGIVPPSGRLQTNSLGDRIPSRCLADLLGQQGYRSAYFTSAERTFERRPEVVENLGYEDFYSVEDMDTEGFQRANYFGYEDDVMLEPSKRWLEENAEDGPFVAAYETITPHHQYLAPNRYGRKDFVEKDGLDRYLNSVRYVDFFVKNLIDQYKEMGLYEDTVFVFYGDHGEAFGEHGRYQHDNVPYEEGLRIPLMILDPGRFENGERVESPVGQIDVLPTVLDLLGYEVEGGEYPGVSLLDPVPEDRTLKAACWYEDECLASIKGDRKFIYNYGDRPDEAYDLSADPDEKNNLADGRDAGWLKERRDELLRWAAEVEAAYEASSGP